MPTDPALLSDLAAAPCGSRTLDERIALALGYCLHERTERTGAQSDTGLTCLDCGADSWGNLSKNGLSQRLHGSIPAFTTSVDAALTLVPEGRRWIVGRSFVLDATPNGFLAEVQSVGAYTRYHECKGLTPALALCIAALRARGAA